METKKKVRAKAGDVFQIAIDAERVSFGQVVENKAGVLRVITFNKTFQSTNVPDVGAIVQNDIVLLTDTMDAKIYNGDWKVIGNVPVEVNLPKPKFKFGTDPLYITEYGGKSKRIATQEEADKLDFQFSVAPIRVQNAMQAYFGLKEWDVDFDKLTFRYCEEKARFDL